MKGIPMRIRVKKLHPAAIIPKYAKPGDAALDLTATEVVSNTTFQIVYGTGLSIEIPEGYVGLIFPRSSICKKELSLSNSVGVVDAGYRGEIRFVFNKANGLDSDSYQPGDRIGQLMIVPHPVIELVESDELSDTVRGTGGFGSSGA
jgi:dUTP pyrophosphatase